MAHLSRRSLNSLSDNSSPSSDASEGSETYEASNHEWQLDSQNSNSLIVDNIDLRFDSLSLDTNSVAEVTDTERAQIESFFSGLGTEVSIFFTTIYTFETNKRTVLKILLAANEKMVLKLLMLQTYCIELEKK